VEESAMANGLYRFVYEMRITAVVRFLDKLRNDNVGGFNGSVNAIPYTQTPSFRPTVKESAMASGFHTYKNRKPTNTDNW